MKKTLSMLLAFVLVFSGCAKEEPTTSKTASDETTLKIESKDETTELTTEATTSETTVETTAETKEPAAPIEFNPHVYSQMLSDAFVKEEWWESFYNMCDAIRAGEDSFKCSDKEAFDWCTDSITIGTLLPAACTLVEGNGYENGVGNLKYKMDKTAFLEREKKFEENIESMLNEAIRSDYSDFEKIFGLYDYFSREIEYDFEENDTPTVDEFSTYACLTTKKGICTEIASSYSYLLLQVGIDALEMGELTQMCHAWTYVMYNGKGYHVDATFAQRPTKNEEELPLRYFMQTDEERIADGMDVPNATVELINWWSLMNNKNCDTSKFTATDTTFEPLHNEVTYKGIDMENNVIKYIPLHGSIEWNLEYKD